ncbi:hypothetical protein ASG01_04830 [Chryseobacterium sp. Leaf180]|uniref:hypothetical protein n=1 Tax=Chryseobacterium sp. Leaf180 TaxID=1736289 RepID=UPI0006FA7440|nr:hypothetical protein [Chryseobacterium sp. Leaf180]KQR95180.1 hypothetical protein ASG01_04830 [Chryseobacterium sp. Leaf180]
MPEFRKVKVTVTRTGKSFTGSFHQWFEKKYEDGTTWLFGLVENEKGVMQLCDFQTYEFEFLPEEKKEIRYFEPS